jgi:hypothetical protein
MSGVRRANESQYRDCAVLIGPRRGFPEPLAGNGAKVEGRKLTLLLPPPAAQPPLTGL